MTTYYKTIPDLPLAAAATFSDQIEISQSGVSRRISVGQLGSAGLGAIDLASLGIVSDGSDKTGLLNSIFATYGGVAYQLNKVGSGTVLTTGPVNMPNGGVLTMADDVVWEAGLISFQGSVGSARNFTARVANDAIDYPFDTTAIAVDDWVYVLGCTNLGSVDAGADQLTWSADLSPSLAVYPGQFLRARTITPTILTAIGGARWAYEITPGPASGTRTISQAFKVAFISGGIRGGTLRMWSGGTADSLVTMKWAREVFIEDTRFDMMTNEPHQCVNMQKSFNCRVRRCAVNRHIDGSGGTLRNSFNVQSCQGIEFSSNFVVGGGQNFDISVMLDDTTAPSWDCSIIGNTIVSAGEGATSHPGSTNIRIDNNRIVDCDRGIRIRTTRSSANFNTILNARNLGIGISLENGWFDGTTVIGNIIEGFTQGITANFNSSGNLLPVTTTWTDNIVRNSTTGLLVLTDAVNQNATTKAVVIRGGEVSGTTGMMGLFTDFRSYCNGLSVEGVTFAGSATFATSGIVVLPANISDVRIGTNWFRNTGTVPCINGPGATAISDLVAFPAGEAAARWMIEEQKVIGTGSGPGTASMPAVAFGTAVAQLATAASYPGMTKYVLDATGPVIGSNVAGGGAAKVLVASNGANWKVTAIL